MAATRTTAVGQAVPDAIAWIISRPCRPASATMNWTRWLQWKPHVSSLIPHAFNSRDLASLTSLEVDEHLAKAGEGMSDSTRHHDAVAVQHIENRTSSFVAFVLFCSRLVGTGQDKP